jgi:hypothetical protein
MELITLGKGDVRTVWIGCRSDVGSDDRLIHKDSSVQGYHTMIF